MRVLQFVFTYDFGGGFETCAQVGGAQDMLGAMIENRFNINRANVDWLERNVPGDRVDVDQEYGILIVGLGDQSLQHITLGLNVDLGSRRRHVVEDDPLTRLGLVDAC